MLSDEKAHLAGLFGVFYLSEYVVCGYRFHFFQPHYIFLLDSKTNFSYLQYVACKFLVPRYFIQLS